MNNSMEAIKPIWLKDREIAVLLGISRAQVWKLEKTNENFPKHFKFGCSTRWKAEDIYRFAELASSNQ